MSAAQWAFAGYLGWLAAGLGDFACHRRTGIGRTSGLAESAMHVMQLGTIGLAALAWLLFAPSAIQLAILSLLVAAHAAMGYADTRIAHGVREILPIEQHVHSVLDMAPWIALAVIAWTTWPAALDAGWHLSRRPWAEDAGLVWALVLVPPLLTLVPAALSEFVASWRARSGPGRR